MYEFSALTATAAILLCLNGEAMDAKMSTTCDEQVTIQISGKHAIVEVAVPSYESLLMAAANSGCPSYLDDSDEENPF
jgi:hypothetical protein